MAGRKQSKSNGLTGQALKEFRHNVALLKKKGLTSKHVDARSQRPTRYMRDKVRKFAEAIDGSHAAVRVSPKIAKQYREAGFKVSNGRVVVSKDPHQIVSARKGELITRVTPVRNAVIEEVILPATVKSLEAFLELIRTNPDLINSLKAPDQLFAFKFFGNNSYATFEDIELLYDYLLTYKEVQGSVHNPEEALQVWENFILYRVWPATVWFSLPRPSRRRNRNKHKEGDKHWRYERQKQTPDEYREKDTARKRQYRTDKKAKQTEAQAERQREKTRLAQRKYRSATSQKFKFD